MASYQKLTLDRFKIALKEGKYTGLTGARRAIGKTTSWSAKERLAAQGLANAHFGETGDVPEAAPKKSAKKTSAKKTTAKASAKSIVKPAKKTPAKRAASSSANAGVGTASAQREIKPGSALEHRVTAHESVGFVGHARVELEQLKIMNPKLDTSKNEKALFDLLENAIAHMGLAVVPAVAQASAVPRIQLPKTDENGNFPDKPSRVVKNIVTDVAPIEAQTVGDVQQNGHIDDEDLTPAERSARDLLQGTGPDLGLPRPQQV